MIMCETVSCRVPRFVLVLIGLASLPVIPTATQAQSAATQTAPVPQPALDPSIAAPTPAPAPAPAGEGLPATTVRTVDGKEVFETEVRALPPATQDREARLEEIEARLSQLLMEIKSLRGSTVRTPPALPTLRARSAPIPQSQPRTALLTPAPAAGKSPAAAANIRYTAASTASRRPTQMLSRAQYDLPQGKAEALAAFIKEHVSTEVEVKVTGDTITVTAAPEAQAAIDTFISLLMPPKAGRFGGASEQRPAR